jgi:hypothetical protein
MTVSLLVLCSDSFSFFPSFCFIKLAQFVESVSEMHEGVITLSASSVDDDLSVLSEEQLNNPTGKKWI